VFVVAFAYPLYAFSKKGGENPRVSVLKKKVTLTHGILDVLVEELELASATGDNVRPRWRGENVLQQNVLKLF
jgi:hypothetical protein